MKAKFGNLNFDSVDTLSRAELKKVIGGYGPVNNPPGTVICSYTCTTIGGGSTTAYGPPSTDPCPWYAATAPGPCTTY
jgi:hypothetical protein